MRLSYRLHRVLCYMSIVLMWITAGIYCETPTHQMQIPEGFARFTNESDIIKAVSADGVRMKTGTFPNKERGDLDLWRQSLRIHFAGEGTPIIKEDKIRSADGMPGYAFTLRYSRNNIAYSYLVALFVEKERIHILEAGGPEAAFTRHEANIRKALMTIRLR